MIEITDDVRRILKDGLKEYCDDGRLCFRLMEPTGDRAILMLDTKNDGDVVVEHDGTTLLIIEPTVASSLDGTTIYIREADLGPMLIVEQRAPVPV
jgi:hypothetical protein